MTDDTEKIEKLFCLAQNRFHELDLAQAISSLKALLQLDFSHLEAHFLLGIIYQKDQSYELSNKHFHHCLNEKLPQKQLYKLLASNLNYLALYKDAIYQSQKYLHLYPDDDDAYALLGDIYMNQQEYHFAIKVYEDAIKLSPQHAQYYYKLSQACLLASLEHDALLNVKKALVLDTKYHEAYALQAKLYDLLHDYEHALNSYQEAIKIAPHIAVYHHDLSNIYFLTGERKLGNSALLEAIILEPHNKKYSKNLFD